MTGGEHTRIELPPVDGVAVTRVPGGLELEFWEPAPEPVNYEFIAGTYRVIVLDEHTASILVRQILDLLVGGS